MIDWNGKANFQWEFPFRVPIRWSSWITAFRACFFILWIALGVGPATGWAESGDKVLQWEKGAQGDPDLAKNPKDLGWGQRVGIQLMNIFIRYISPVDGDRCPCYPTCSDYSRQAIAKHGLLVGGIMTFDRLLHEGDEIHRVPRVRIHGVERYYDPVENNDFWWYKKRH